MSFFRKILAAFTATSFAFANSAAFAQTAPANGTQYGDWRLACQATAVNQTSCAIAQTLSTTEQKRFLAEVTLQFLEFDGENRIIMAVSTPTNMLLPAQPGYRVGKSGETLPLAWRTCNAQFCTASRLLEDTEVSALRNGLSFVLGYQPINQKEPLVFEISLKGVSAGLNALNG